MTMSNTNRQSAGFSITSQPLAPGAAAESAIEQQEVVERRPRTSSRMRKLSSRSYKVSSSFLAVLVSFVALLSSSQLSQYGALVEAGNNNNYNNGNYNNGNYNNGNYNDDGNNKNDDNGGDDNGGDDYYGRNDDGARNYNNDDTYDDAYAYNNDGYNNDDANGNDDANDDFNVDDGAMSYSNAEEEAYANADDDVFRWNSNEGFDGVSVMPISCINYNGGQMIKFQLFDSENSYQCHFSEIATFVVSIAHYMRAYFNYQAILRGTDFELPGDAAYLNCVMLQETVNNDVPLYAKIGCVDRETFTSTKLQLHVYTDKQCSQPYDDGQTSKRHVTKGYDINGYIFPTRVSFRPPFYTCDTCSPELISNTFNKANSNWYDDYVINSNSGNDEKDENNDDAADDAYAQANDDVQRDDDAYKNQGDDAYYAAGNDGNNGDDNGYSKYSNQNGYNYQNYNKYNGNNGNRYSFNDDYYNDDGGRMRHRFLQASEKGVLSSVMAAAPGQIEAYYNEFWSEYDEMINHRSLYNNYYDLGDWNMCQRIYKYGVWCDEECRALDFFRTDQWSASDIFLLAIMCTFVTAMMLLVVAKRLKAQQKAKIYGDDQPMPGLPPLAMALIFFVIMTIIVALAKLRFVNETLVFAVVTCILLFIYMLKLTLFETRRPVLLAAPRHHELFDTDYQGL